MANEQNLGPPWKPGQSGNLSGRRPVEEKLKALRDASGAWPREELLRIARDNRVKLETRVRCLQYLDQQFNGKAKQTRDTQMHVEGDLALLMREIDGNTRTVKAGK